MSIEPDRPQIPDRGLELQLAKQTAAKREPRVSVDQEMPDLPSSTARPGSAGQLLPPGTVTATSHIPPMSSATSQASHQLNTSGPGSTDPIICGSPAAPGRSDRLARIIAEVLCRTELAVLSRQAVANPPSEDSADSAGTARLGGRLTVRDRRLA